MYDMEKMREACTKALAYDLHANWERAMDHAHDQLQGMTDNDIIEDAKSRFLDFEDRFVAKPDMNKLVFTHSHMEQDDDRIEHCFGTQVPGVYADLYRDLPDPSWHARLRIDTDLSDFQLLLPITHPDDVQALLQRVPSDNISLAEGWAVFDGHPHGLQIQRDDEAAIFDSDLAAWVHVITKARDGSKLHKEALRQVRDDNETDWAKMDLVAYGMGIENLEEIL